jgi:hypothetical protein
MVNGGLAARCRREFCPSKGNEGQAFLPERSGGQQMLTEATVVGNKTRFFFKKIIFY